MRERTSQVQSASPGTIVAKILVLVIGAALIFVSLRVPLPLAGKIPLLIAMIFLARWLWSIPRKMEGNTYFGRGVLAERRGDHKEAARNYEMAIMRLPRSPHVALRLLTAYDSLRQINRAGDMVPFLDGALFNQEEASRIEELVSRYRSLELTPARGRFRLKLH